MRILLAAAALCSLAAACAPKEPPGVQALDAWCRPTPAQALTAACYLTLTANTDDRLVSVTTPRARRAEIHTMSVEGGIMRMGPLSDGLKLPRNQAVALKSGGEHLMLIGPTAPFVEGETVAMTLAFEKAPSVVVDAAVRRTPVAGAHPAAH